MEATFRSCVNELRDAGRTVLLSSHILSEVEALCDRVSIIRNGAVVETGSMSQLRHLTRTAVHAEVDDASRRGSGRCPGCTTSTSRVCASPRASSRPPCPALLAALSQAGVTSLSAQPPTLEELFLRHYERPTP